MNGLSESYIGLKTENSIYHPATVSISAATCQHDNQISNLWKVIWLIFSVDGFRTGWASKKEGDVQQDLFK